MHPLRGVRIEVQPLFLSQIFFNALQIGGRFVREAMTTQVVGSGDRLDSIGSFQRDESALPLALEIQPKDVTTPLDAAVQFCGSAYVTLHRHFFLKNTSLSRPAQPCD
jgi:hypothetical protein